MSDDEGDLVENVGEIEDVDEDEVNKPATRKKNISDDELSDVDEISGSEEDPMERSSKSEIDDHLSGSDKPESDKDVDDDKQSYESDKEVHGDDKESRESHKEWDRESDDEVQVIDRNKQARKQDSDDDDEDGDASDEEASKKKEGAAIEQEGNDKEGDDEEDEEEEEEEEEEDVAPPPPAKIYDFDIMMAKKKEENKRKRKRRNYDDINDNDDIIDDIINQMRNAVDVDNEANLNRQAATRKLQLLPFIMTQLRKVDLRGAFLDSDVLSVMTKWLAPLPDRSLPHLHIRENLLKILIDFNLYDVDRIKASGIGKAVMYLYKHPKETRDNKDRAKQLISDWSRPIFQLDSNFSAISREEREQRDLELMSKQRRASKNDDSSDAEAGGSSSQKKIKEDAPPAQKPGDKGWIPRARVPAPSMRDYVVRPRSKAEGDIGKNSKRPANMLEKYLKNQQDRKRAGRQQRAINMKIDRG